MNKTCGKCKTEKSLEEFGAKGKKKNGEVRYQPFCKECNRFYLKEHYQKNKKYYYDKSKNFLHKSRVQFLEYLKDKSCKDCGISDNRVLEFDHLRDKRKDVTALVGLVSWEEVLKEIDKCEIVCCNCHRIRTLQRANSYRSRGIA